MHGWCRAASARSARTFETRALSPCSPQASAGIFRPQRDYDALKQSAARRLWELCHHTGGHLLWMFALATASTGLVELDAKRSDLFADEEEESTLFWIGVAVAAG